MTIKIKGIFKTLLFVALPLIVWADFAIDGCIELFGGGGVPVCGELAKSDVIVLTGSWLVIGVILGIKTVKERMGKSRFMKNKVLWIFYVGIAIFSTIFLLMLMDSTRSRGDEFVNNALVILGVCFVSTVVLGVSIFRRSQNKRRDGAILLGVGILGQLLSFFVLLGSMAGKICKVLC